jgi:hypothetical protein
MPLIKAKDLDDLPVESVLDPGRYLLNCTKASINEKGKRPSIQLQLKVVDAPDQSNGNDVIGKMVFDRIFYTFDGMSPAGKEINLRRYYNFCEAFGVDPKDEYDTDDLTGTEVYAAIKHGLDMDKELREEIRKYFPV